LVDARQTSIKRQNQEWIDRHTDEIRRLVKEHMPSGSGWDMGTTLDLSASTPERLVFNGSWHHMTEVGMYDGWTDHEVIVKPSLLHDLHIRITGRDRNYIKDVIHESFLMALTQTVSM
jgi:hypothetical protein